MICGFCGCSGCLLVFRLWGCCEVGFQCGFRWCGFLGVVFLGDFGLGGVMVFGGFRFDLCCCVLGLYGCVVGLAGVGCFCGLV